MLLSRAKESYLVIQNVFFSLNFYIGTNNFKAYASKNIEILTQQIVYRFEKCHFSNFSASFKGELQRV